MPQRTSKTEHEYPMGTKRVKGEPFEVAQEDVFLLAGLGRIEPEEGDLAGHDTAAEGNYQTRHMTAQPPSRKRGQLHRSKGD